MFNLDLPENDDYMTVGGMILHYYQSIPKLNEIVKIGKFSFKIIKNTMTKIALVRLKIEDWGIFLIEKLRYFLFSLYFCTHFRNALS